MLDADRTWRYGYDVKKDGDENEELNVPRVFISGKASPNTVPMNQHIR